jgi:UTP--glucose-1-phosphate uridylyltransferase
MRLQVGWPYWEGISSRQRFFQYWRRLVPGKGGEIQLTDALRVLAMQEPVYAYDFDGIRYDLGNKLGFLRATVEYALRRDDLKDSFEAYLKEIVKEMK